MTNMSPQKPGFNRGIWKNLESAVRNLAAQEKYVEVYAICGPLFKIGDADRRYRRQPCGRARWVFQIGPRRG